MMQPSQRFGQMRVILTLEDFGSVATSAQQRVQLQSSGIPTVSAASASSVAQGNDAARANLEYQVAWELEMWKRSEQAAFEARLRDIEQQRMRELEAEFAKADSKRQEQLARKQAELLALELRNKTFFQDLEAQVRGFVSRSLVSCSLDLRCTINNWDVCKRLVIPTGKTPSCDVRRSGSNATAAHSRGRAAQNRHCIANETTERGACAS